MKDFLQRNIIFISVVGITLLVLIGGVFLFSKTPDTKVDSKKISDEVLAPSGVYKTSGIKEGKHLPPVDNSSVTLVEFGDFQCPACSAYYPLVKKVMEEFNGKINFVFRNYPLPSHKNATPAHQAAEAAGIQGKFWEMHDAIYENQEEWSASTKVEDTFETYAKDSGLDVKKYKTDVKSEEVKNRINKDLADGNLAGITGTPTFFLNGQKIGNPQSYEAFKKLIEDALAKNPITASSDTKAFHAHYDIKIYTGGVAADLSLPKYQSEKGKELSDSTHVHDGNGKVVHLHKAGVSIKDFTDSVKINFPADTTTSTLKVFVNGTLNAEGLTYKPNDLDQVLVTYGSSDQDAINSQIKSISNDACIYSEKCPERGKPPTEECVGGLGTDCEVKK